MTLLNKYYTINTRKRERMPSITGGDQLDADYAPWAKSPLNEKEKGAVRKIKANNKKIALIDNKLQALSSRRVSLAEENQVLRKKCRHQNTSQGEGAYGAVYSWCVDCGAKNV